MGEKGIQIMTRLINKIYKSGYIPEDFRESIFVPIPKVSKAQECGDFRTIALISHASKVLLHLGGVALVRPRRPPGQLAQNVMETCKIITFSPSVGARQKLETQRSARACDSEIFKGQRLAKIKSNIMKGTTKLWRRTAQNATWGSPLPLVKTQSGEPGGAVDRGGLVPQRRDVFEVAPSHNRVYDERKRPDNPRGCRLRVGSWNVGTMSRRDGEVADMASRRCLDFCCLQETRWRGEGNKWLGAKGKRYKFFWKGKDGLAGVGVLVAEKWVERLIEVKKMSERMMLLRVSIGANILNVISGYASQVGCSIEDKEEFLLALSRLVDETGQEESLVIGGDMNGHVGAKAAGYEGVRGGKGYGVRNTEGEMLLEFADAMKLVGLNTWFTKDRSQKITYVSGVNKSVVDYMFVRRCDLAKVSDINVIGSEECVQQHKLLICKIDLQESVKKRKEKFVGRHKVWRLVNIPYVAK